MIDIPHLVFRDILRDTFMAAFEKALETTRLDLAQEIFDAGIDTLHHALECGEYREVHVIDEIRADLGEHAHILDDIDCRELVMCQLTLHDKPLFEAGRMACGDDLSYPDDETMKGFGEPALRAFGKATVKALRRHEMAQNVEDLQHGAKGALSHIFSELLDEVIAEEIDDQCAEFRDRLADMLTVDAIPKPWSAPKGGERHDLPSPE